GIPLRSSSTTHQIAPGIVAPYCLRVRSLSLLRGARARVPSPRSTRHPGSPRRGAAPPFRNLPPASLCAGTAHARTPTRTSDRFRFFAERAHEFLHRGRHVTLDDAARRPRRKRLEPDDAELWRLRPKPEISRLEVFDLLLLRAHDSFERRVPRL